MTQYGVLDDFGAVVRWIDYKPAHGRYITRKVARPRGPTMAELINLCGESPF